MNTMKAGAQKGFTLVELIVVIVILGILSAVAIPKFTNASKGAYEGVQDATLAALKSAWSVAYATNKGRLPTTAELAAQMQDPACAAATDGLSITCTGVTKNDGTGQATFTVANPTAVASPADITITSIGRGNAS
ncbi:type II secretion system protein [Lacisediminimonas profundi]|uniref:type II secretion system protein n=1 Tax=Lacisediminimonas profundi TaxID=2603856 RepID=UPI001386D21B|nr:prepilin-type N-terminal cleavage/methylation domain-containing protein [Lacisediminimonas profundi]